MPSSYFYFKHRKEADKIGAFLLIVVIISLIIGVLFPSINKKKDKVKDETEKINNADTMQRPL
jgi:hypothetical protein